MTIDLTLHNAPTSSIRRMFACMYRQHSKNRRCPDLPRLDGKTALITGGTSGIGKYISLGLLARGARVISLSRGVSDQGQGLRQVESIQCDLSVPSSVVAASDSLGSTKIDILIGNSGVLLQTEQKTIEGIEKTFSVNVLGHHLLYRRLINRGQLAENARIVLTSGDAYVMSTDCLPHPTSYKADVIYGGSKLGNLWQVKELSRRYPDVHAIAVHPGVVLSGFIPDMKTKTGPISAIQRKILLTEQEGAEASLIAATQELPRGSYWHNTQGLMQLSPDDVGSDTEKSRALWDTLEQLSSSFI